MDEGWKLNLCANIRYLRNKYGISKTRMAKILGVGVKTINELENDIVPRRMSSAALFRTADYFSLSTDISCGTRIEE